MSECQHEWVMVGGRGCPKHETNENMCIGRRKVREEGIPGWHWENVYCNQAVYQCAKCGEYDYGYTGGPGYDQCYNHCPLDQ